METQPEGLFTRARLDALWRMVFGCNLSSPSGKLQTVVAIGAFAVMFVVAISLLGFAIQLKQRIGNAYFPPTPLIEASMRTSLLDSKTGVLVLKNISGRPLTPVSIHVRNLDNGQSAQHKLQTLTLGEAAELGLMEMNWKFIPHEEVRILYQDYRFNADPQAPLYTNTHREDFYETFEAGTGILGLRRIKSEPVRTIDTLSREAH